MPLSASDAAKIKNLADGGDLVAKSIINGTKNIKLTAAAEAVNSIKVTGQVQDGAGNPIAGIFEVLVQSVPVAGTGLLTDGGFGAVVAGSGSKLCWMTTDSAGRFQVDVANANAEANLVVAQVPDCEPAMLRLTFV